MESSKQGVPFTIPSDIWQPLMEVRAHLDSLAPGSPTPVAEVLREVINHYKHCSRAVDEVAVFRERAKAWKR